MMWIRCRDVDVARRFFEMELILTKVGGGRYNRGSNTLQIPGSAAGAVR